MSRIEEHINRLFRDIPDSERKQQIMQEITQDLEEKVADLIKQGKAMEDAVNKAIVDFGDIDDIRAELTYTQKDKKSRKNRNAALNLGFSIWGAAITIALFIFINFYYTPTIIWFVYPTFGMLWWPVAMFFNWLRKRREDEGLE